MCSNKSSLSVNPTLNSEIQPGRNKVALKPGHSLMDWIRLGHSGKDLTGVGGKFRNVTTEELEKHCTRDNMWLGLRGKVYNVTHYLDYHPGGVDELMKGAGIDATDLFNEIHKWVNAESMLEKCLIGKLITTPHNKVKKGSNKTNLQAPDTMEINKKNSEFKSPGPLEIQVIKPPNLPSYEWFDIGLSVILVIRTHMADLPLNSVVVDMVTSKEMLIQVQLNPSYLYNFHLELTENVLPKFEISMKSGDLQLILLKESSDSIWSDLGASLENHNNLFQIIDKEPHFRSYTLKSKTQITHDSYLFEFEPKPGCWLRVPIGHHVQLQAQVEGMVVSRNYTPVISNWDSVQNKDSSIIELLVKIYPTGALTPVLNQLNIGDKIDVSDPSGDFEMSQLSSCDYLCLVAAGTGYTPMIKLINWVLNNPMGETGRLVKILFFNKTQKDIYWKERLDVLVNEPQNNTKFEVIHILSEPDDSWTGLKGRVRPQILESHLPQPITHPNVMICVCGPRPFTNLTLKILGELNYSSKYIHAFVG